MKSLENNYIPRRAISRRIPVAPDTPPTPPARSPPPRGRAEARRRSERGGVRAPEPRRARGSRVKVRRRPKKQRGERRGADRPSPNGNDGRSRSTGGFVSAGRDGDTAGRGARRTARRARGRPQRAGRRRSPARLSPGHRVSARARRPKAASPKAAKIGAATPGPRGKARGSRREPSAAASARHRAALFFRFPRSSRPAAGPRPAFAKKSASRPRRAESVKRKNGPAARKFSA